MKLHEIVSWYQKKIGTYDKQQWEKTVEQKILDGFNSVTLKNAKLKTELIDVDLVRGSTFPKAKPKQTLLTVIRLAILRYIFLPLYAKWWVRQTSPNVFAILIFMYIAQMINWAVYTYNTHHLENSNYHNVSYALNSSITTNEKRNSEEHIVSVSDLIIPMALSLLLSLIHSQIVATNIITGSKVKRRRFSNPSLLSKANRVTTNGGETRIRRRKKLSKIRIADGSDISNQNQRKPNKPTVNKFASGVENLANKNVIFDSSSASIESYKNHQHQKEQTSQLTAVNLKLDLISVTNERTPNNSITINNIDHKDIKKRNVNWHSPIDNMPMEEVITRCDKGQQTSPNILTSSSSTSSSCYSPNNVPNIENSIGLIEQIVPDDTNNFTKLSPQPKVVRIDDCVLEFYDDLIMRTSLIQSKNDSANETCNNDNQQIYQPRRTVGEDDGFESLNGKSSSGEETTLPINASSSTSSTGAIANQLRFRVNTENMQTITENKSNLYRRKVPLSSESEFEKMHSTNAIDSFQQTKKLRSIKDASSDETEEEGDDGENISSPNSLGNNSNYTECTTSATEWLGVTTNSEDCSYSSELENSDHFKSHHNPMTDDDGFDGDFTPNTILNPHGACDRISCTIWDQHDIKKAHMTVLEISSCIIERVESMPETHDYIYIGIGFSILLSLVPVLFRLCEVTFDTENGDEINYFDIPILLWEKSSFSIYTIFHFAFGNALWERTVLIIAFIQRLCLTIILFIIFAVAERTYKQRFLYGKLFSHLTSSRRARKSNLPHFRLNKVRNIKTWLSVRSYLKKRGPQRSVDVIVSAAFIVTLLLLSFLSVEWLKDSVHLHAHLNLEALFWSTCIGIFLLRFMTLGNQIHHKYRSVSVLITEQINLYLQIEQKPKKKDELMVSNSVLKLAADLLKELESPFKISGLSANPYLFTTIKVVILSALSGVLSEMLGFKLKLHKIKIK